MRSSTIVGRDNYPSLIDEFRIKPEDMATGEAKRVNQRSKGIKRRVRTIKRLMDAARSPPVPHVQIGVEALKTMLGSYQRGPFGGSFSIPGAVATWVQANPSFLPLLLMLEATKNISEEKGLLEAFPYAAQCAPYLHARRAAIQVDEKISLVDGEDPKAVIRLALEALAMQGHTVEGEVISSDAGENDGSAPEG